MNLLMRTFIASLAFSILSLWQVPLYAQLDIQSDTNWKSVGINAQDISVSNNSSVFIIDPQGSVWGRSYSDNEWINYQGSLKRIATDAQGQPWGVDSSGSVVQYRGGVWQLVGSGATDITRSGKDIVVTTNTGSLARLNTTTGRWSAIKGRGLRVASASDETLWTVASNGDVARLVDDAWIGVIGAASDISVADNGQVLMLGLDENLYLWQEERSSWIQIANTENSTSLAITSSGGIWRANSLKEVLALGVALNRSNITETQGSNNTSGSEAPEEIIDTSPINFLLSVGKAQDISIGSEGSIFTRLVDRSLQRWSNIERRFNAFPGELARLAVDQNGLPWGVGINNTLYRNDGIRWEELSIGIAVQDIAINNSGEILLLDTLDRAYLLNQSFTAVSRIAGTGQQVAISPDSETYWIINKKQQIFRCMLNGDCKRQTGLAIDIDIGPGGSVFIVDEKNSLRVLNSETNKFDLVRQGRTLKVAVGPNDRPWIINTNGDVLPTEFFQRDESNDRRVVAVSEDSADITEPDQIAVNLSQTVISAMHTVGLSSCPQILASINVSLNTSNAFSISNIQITGDLVNLVDVNINESTSDNSQNIVASFNCSDVAPGLKSGEIRATLSDAVTGLRDDVVIPVSLNVQLDDIVVTLSDTSLSGTHNIGIDSCPQVIGIVKTSLTSGNEFSVSNIMLTGDLSDLVDIVITPNGSSSSQDIIANYNCEDLTPITRNGNITATITDDVTRATTTLLIPIVLEVILESIEISLSPVSLTATHMFGITSCPQLIGTVNTSLTNGRDFTLSDTSIDGGLQGVIDVDIDPNTSAATQNLSLSFNCSDATAGLRSGTVSALATDTLTGATTSLSIPVSLDVVIPSITITASPISLNASHSVGITSCPQLIGNVDTGLSNGGAFTLSNLSVDGSLVGVIDTTVSPGGSAASQEIAVSFNCSDATAGTRTGNITADVTDDMTGATTTLSIPVSFEVVIPAITIISSPLSVTATHSVGVTSCPQLLDTVTTTLTNGDDFTLSNVSVDGGLVGVIDTTVSPGGSATSQAITVNFNCSDVTEGTRTGNITADVIDDITGATTTLSIPVNLMVAIDPIFITATPTLLSEIHSVGISSCPQLLGTVSTVLTNGNAFSLSSLSVDGGLVGVIDTILSPGGSSTSQDISVNFNCSDATAGIRSGNITATVTDDVSGATTLLSVPVTLDVVIPPITITASPLSLTAIHSVGVTSCPQLLDTITTTLTNGDDFTLSNVSVDGGLVGVIDTTISPGGSSASQDIAVSFNCSDPTAGIRTGNITADVIDDITGATTTLSVPVSLEVVEPPIMINVTPTFLTEIHTVGVSECPQELGTINIELSSGNNLTISNLNVDGGLVGVIDTVLSPGGSSTPQVITVSFNCSDATVGMRTGNIMADVTDDDTGMTVALSVPVSLEVLIPSIMITSTPASITATHTVGVTSCPQLAGTVSTALASGNNFTLANLNVDGDLVGIVNPTLSPGDPFVTQDIEASFNCSDLTAGIRTGNITADVTDEDTGMTTTLIIPVTLEVVIPPPALLISPSSITETHEIALSNCPQDLGSISVAFDNDELFELTALAVDGDLVGVIVVSQAPGGIDFEQTLSVGFNCSDMTVLMRTGNITGTMTNNVTGAIANLSIPVTLDVIASMGVSGPGGFKIKYAKDEDDTNTQDEINTIIVDNNSKDDSSNQGITSGPTNVSTNNITIGNTIAIDNARNSRLRANELIPEELQRNSIERGLLQEEDLRRDRSNRQRPNRFITNPRVRNDLEREAPFRPRVNNTSRDDELTELQIPLGDVDQPEESSQDDSNTRPTDEELVIPTPETQSQPSIDNSERDPDVRQRPRTQRSPRAQQRQRNRR